MKLLNVIVKLLKVFIKKQVKLWNYIYVCVFTEDLYAVSFSQWKL